MTSDGRREPGTLFVVATPLGNLEDLSPRARRVLAEVDLVACEDTRRTGNLLQRFELSKRLVSFHKFNEAGRTGAVIEHLESGGSVALVSDGGTPGVSDPGSALVAAAHASGIPTVAVPGPSAPTALLSVSGFSGDRFVFEGFLPHRAGERRARLRELADERRTVVFLESPHRIVETLRDLDAIFGDRPTVIGRELTKLHEAVARGTAATLGTNLEATGAERGEFTIAIEGVAPRGDAEGNARGHGAEPPAGRGRTRDDEEAARVADAWRRALDAEGGDHRRALRRAARELGTRRSELQRTLVERGFV